MDEIFIAYQYNPANRSRIVRKGSDSIEALAMWAAMDIRRFADKDEPIVSVTTGEVFESIVDIRKALENGDSVVYLEDGDSIRVWIGVLSLV